MLLTLLSMDRYLVGEVCGGKLLSQQHQWAGPVTRHVDLHRNGVKCLDAVSFLFRIVN